MTDLRGRVVVVAGADTEAGAAHALALTAAGAALVLCGADTVALGTLAAAIGDSGGRVSVFTGDPDDEADRADLSEMVSELFPEPSADSGSA